MTFTLRLPQTLAITQALFCRSARPSSRCRWPPWVGSGASPVNVSNPNRVYHYAGESTNCTIWALVGQPVASAEGQSQVPLLLVRAGDLRAAVAMDQVLGNREIVVKPVGLQIASVPGIYGATITGDGNMVVILDVAPLVRRHILQPRPRPEAAPE